LSCSFFPLRQFDPRLHQMPFPVERSADAGLAFLCDARVDLRQLFFVQQEFSGPRGVRDEVRRGSAERVNVGAQQIRLAVFHQDVGIRELDFACSQCLDLPSGQRDARLKRVEQLILVACSFVLRDGIV
jgi:hypothetical protein